MEIACSRILVNLKKAIETIKNKTQGKKNPPSKWKRMSVITTLDLSQKAGP